MKQTKTLLDKLLLKYLDRNKGVYSFFNAGLNLIPKKSTLSTSEKKDIFQGFLNYSAINLNLHKFWPQWVLRQLTPSDPFYTPHINKHILNHTQKNWTSLSRDESKINAQISPMGVCTPCTNEWSVDSWIEYKNIIDVQSQATTTQRLVEQAPIIETTWNTNDIETKIEQFIDPKLPICHQKNSYTNTSSKPISFTVYVCIQPFNTEGVSAINELTYLSNHSVVINGSIGLICDQVADNVLLLNRAESNNIKNLKNWEKIYHTECPENQCSGYLIYPITLESHETKELSFKLNTVKKNIIPLLKKELSGEESKMLSQNMTQLKHFAFDSSRKQLLDTYQMKVPTWKTPDQDFNTALYNSATYLDTAIETLGITSVSKEKTFSKIQQLCMILAYNRLGWFDKAQKLCTGLKNQWFKDPLLDYCYWIIASHDYIAYANDDVYRINYSIAIEKSMKKIVRSPIQELIQPNLEDSIRRSKNLPCSLDEFSKVTWTYMAIIMGDAILSKNTTPIETTVFKEFIQKAEHFIVSELEILNAQCTIMESSDELLPQLLLLYPTQFPSKITELVPNIVNRLLTQTERSGLYHASQNGEGVPSSQNMHLLNGLIRSKSPHWQSFFTQLKTFQNGTHAWPEYINPKSKGGCRGDGHDRLSNALLIIAGHNSLINETTESITICPTIPDNCWSETPSTISAQNLHTSTGTISFDCTFTNQKVDLSIKERTVQKPIAIDFKRPIKYLQFNNQDKTISGTAIHLKKSTKTVSIEFE